MLATGKQYRQVIYVLHACYTWLIDEITRRLFLVYWFPGLNSHRENQCWLLVVDITRWWFCLGECGNAGKETAENSVYLECTSTGFWHQPYILSAGLSRSFLSFLDQQRCCDKFIKIVMGSLWVFETFHTMWSLFINAVYELLKNIIIWTRDFS